MNKLRTSVCLCLMALLSSPVQAQTINPSIAASLERDVTMPQRDVRRLLDEAAKK